jgi:phosphoglycolate phosphatase
MREEFFVNYESAMTERTTIFEGIPALIASLLELGLKWGVVTNKSMRFTGPLTKQIPFFRSAGAIVGGDTTPYSKPHPGPLLEAAKRLSVPAQQCIYVGDDERDIAAARAAGMPSVAATYGYLGSNADVYVWKADAHIARPLELLSLLKKAAAA